MPTDWKPSLAALVLLISQWVEAFHSMKVNGVNGCTKSSCYGYSGLLKSWQPLSPFASKTEAHLARIVSKKLWYGCSKPIFLLGKTGNRFHFPFALRPQPIFICGAFLPSCLSLLVWLISHLEPIRQPGWGQQCTATLPIYLFLRAKAGLWGKTGGQTEEAKVVLGTVALLFSGWFMFITHQR